MDKPIYSLCTTNYNCAHALQQHLDSIYSQLNENEFEYIIVDNKSKDNSMDVLEKFASTHNNITVLQKRCVRGVGRQIAFRKSKGMYIIQVDTDTLYLPVWSNFLYKCCEEYPKFAVQAIYSGIYPRRILEEVGGWRDFQYSEDFDLWMRIWRIDRMKWYPLVVGENIKDIMGHDDFLSQRFSRREAMIRLVRHEYDSIRLRRYRKIDLVRIWKENSIDLELGKMEKEWFGRRKSPGFLRRTKGFLGNIRRILFEEV